MDGNSEQRFNVVCGRCGQVWQPSVGSRLWRRAKRQFEKGYLSALTVSGEKCGCVPKASQPDAPYRVKGYTDDCRNFDRPHESFIAAVRDYLALNSDPMLIVFFVNHRSESAVPSRLLQLSR